MVELVDEIILDNTVTESFTDGEQFNFTKTLDVGGPALSGEGLIYVEKMFVDFSMDPIVLRDTNQGFNNYNLSLSDLSVEFGNNFTIPIGDFSFNDESGDNEVPSGSTAPVDASQSSNINADTYLADGTNILDLPITASGGGLEVGGDQNIDFNIKVAMFGRKP